MLYKANSVIEYIHWIQYTENISVLFSLSFSSYLFRYVLEPSHLFLYILDFFQFLQTQRAAMLLKMWDFYWMDLIHEKVVTVSH